jgi:hypothetical protein
LVQLRLGTKHFRKAPPRVCGGDCPAGQNSTGTDPFIVNTRGNVYYDIGWWEQAWLNAYKWTHNKRYLYLAGQLWNYVGFPEGQQASDFRDAGLRARNLNAAMTGSYAMC